MSVLTESLKKAQNGDKNAFSDIVRQYQGLVSGVVFAQIGDFHRSEEITQETFLTAWQELPKLQQREQFPAWICTIARNLAKKSFRPKQAKIDAAVSQFQNGIITEHVTTSTPETEAIRHEQSHIVWNAVSQMPEAQREAIILFYRSGNSIHEIAEITGVSEDAIRQRLVRARTTLREKLESVLDDILTTTSPGETFTMAVIAALPAAMITTTTGCATGISVTTTGGAAAAGGKSSAGIFVVLWTYLFPVAFFAWMVSFVAYSFIAATRNAPTLQSRRFRVYSMFWAAQYYMTFSVILSLGVVALGLLLIKNHFLPNNLPVFLVMFTLAFSSVFPFQVAYRQKMRNLLRKELGLPGQPVESYSYPKVERRFYLSLFTNGLLIEAILIFLVIALLGDAASNRNNNPLFFFYTSAGLLTVTFFLGGIYYVLGRYLLSICRSKEAYLAAPPVVSDPFLIPFGLSGKNIISVERTKLSGKWRGLSIAYWMLHWGLCIGVPVWYFSLFSWNEHPVGLGFCAAYFATLCLVIMWLTRKAKTEREQGILSLCVSFMVITTCFVLNWIELGEITLRFIWTQPHGDLRERMMSGMTQSMLLMAPFTLAAQYLTFSRSQKTPNQKAEFEAELREAVGRFKPDEMPDDEVTATSQPFPRSWKIILAAIFVLIIITACCVCFVYL